MRVGAGDAAVKDVADDDHAQSLELLLVVGDGERVEQRLRGMLMQSVAGVDHGHRNVARQQVRRAAVGMAHHDGVGAERGAPSIRCRSATRPSRCWKR